MKKLFIDIAKLTKKEDALEEIDCEYLYHEGANRGVFSMVELAEFGVYCRQCKESFCVEACPKDALERTETNLVKRYNMLCVGCKSCALACPFGTIFPETINYLTAKCDYCLNQLEDNPDYVPLCVKTAPEDSLEIVDIEEENPDENLFFVGKHIAVKGANWILKSAIKERIQK